MYAQAYFSFWVSSNNVYITASCLILTADFVDEENWKCWESPHIGSSKHAFTKDVCVCLGAGGLHSTVTAWQWRSQDETQLIFSHTSKTHKMKTVLYGMQKAQNAWPDMQEVFKSALLFKCIPMRTWWGWSLCISKAFVKMTAPRTQQVRHAINGQKIGKWLREKLYCFHSTQQQ